MKRIAITTILLLPLLLAGCSNNLMVRPGERDWAPADPLVREPSGATPGAIYQAGFGLSLYPDQRARQVGDVVTINLAERTNASKQSNTATEHDSSISMPGGSLLGGALKLGGRDLLSSNLSGNQKFDGKGSSSQSNSLSGSITVTVFDVLPNGNLRVRGEKWLTLNQGEEFIRVAGTIRPNDIGADNSVPSWKLADARIAYSGKGSLADANSMGWLARFFQAVSPL